METGRRARTAVHGRVQQLAIMLPRAGTIERQHRKRCLFKFDGYRVMTRAERGAATIFARNGHDWTDRMPRLATACGDLPVDDAWLEAEQASDVTRRQGWSETKAFAHAIALHMARVVPQRFSAVLGSKNRVGKIFIDYLRNGRGASTVAPGVYFTCPVCHRRNPLIVIARKVPDDPWSWSKFGQRVVQ